MSDPLEAEDVRFSHKLDRIGYTDDVSSVFNARVISVAEGFNKARKILMRVAKLC